MYSYPTQIWQILVSPQQLTILSIDKTKNNRVSSDFRKIKDRLFCQTCVFYVSMTKS